MNEFELVNRLNVIIDQAKFIRNILVHNTDAELEYVDKCIVELKGMVDRLKAYEN